jgi:hypothetical protein
MGPGKYSRTAEQLDTGTRIGGFALTREKAAGKWARGPIPWSARERGPIGGVGPFRCPL